MYRRSEAKFALIINATSLDLHVVQEYYRLIMAPGMLHCGGGPGPNTFDLQTAVEKWVEAGTAPEAVIASRVAAGVVISHTRTNALA